MKRFNVGIDLDGVIFDFTGAARKEMKGLFAGRPADDLVQTTWAFDSLGITDDEEKIFWRFVDNTPNWWLRLKPLPNTLSLPELVRNHRCVFITNRKDGTGLPIEQQSQLSLETHYGIKAPNVIISNNKGPVAAGLKLDFYIDDRPKNVEEVLGAGIKRTFIKDTTYNGSYSYPRLPHFDAFNALIQKEAYGKS